MQPDADIRTARTLPGRTYGHVAAYEQQRDLVFARTWHVLAGIEDACPAAGARPLTLLPGSLEEPVLLSRDGEGRSHCLANVCTHRGALLLDAPCAGPTLRCPYHGRRFGLDGKLVSAPGFEDVDAFPSERDHLPAVPSARFGSLLFASVAPAHPFERLVAGSAERLAFFPWDRAVPDPDGARDYEVAAHWALWCDNYLEGFHIPYVHPGLARALDLREYRTELYELASLQIGIAADGDAAFELPPGHPDAHLRVAGYYLFLFPATALNFYPWGVSVNTIQPLGPDRTRIRYRSYVVRPELREVGAGAALDRVEHEDDAIVERTQRGVRSRLYDRGRYSARHEKAVHHFHRLLGELLAT